MKTILTVIFIVITLTFAKGGGIKDIPLVNVEFLVYLSDSEKINENYYQVVRSLLPDSTPVIKIRNIDEMKARLNGKKNYFYFRLNWSSFQSSYSSYHSNPSGTVTSSTNYQTLFQYHLTICSYNSGFERELKSKNIFLYRKSSDQIINNNLVNLRGWKFSKDYIFYNVHGYSPQISPLHIGALLSEDLKFNKEDQYLNLDKIRNDTLYFTEVYYKVYRPMAYGMQRKIKRKGRVNPYKHPKVSVNSNDELVSIYLRRLKNKQPMYIYDYIRNETENYYIIQDIVNGDLMYFDFDNFGYNQRKRFIRRMNKRISEFKLSN